MEYTLHVKMNERLFLRDPDQSDLGRRIIQQGILMMDELGFEDLTFRKLAERMGTKEASIYRYFENKHRLLVYLVAWYWRWLDYQVVFQTNNMTDAHARLERVLALLLEPDTSVPGSDQLDVAALYRVVVREASKAYLTRHVTEDNKQQLFKPYKDLCGRISGIMLDYAPGYPFARSLASTLLEMAHFQTFFMEHLPSLTDFGAGKDQTQLQDFLTHLMFASLDSHVAVPQP